MIDTAELVQHMDKNTITEREKKFLETFQPSSQSYSSKKKDKIFEDTANG